MEVLWLAVRMQSPPPLFLTLALRLLCCVIVFSLFLACLLLFDLRGCSGFILRVGLVACQQGNTTTQYIHSVRSLVGSITIKKIQYRLALI